MTSFGQSKISRKTPSKEAERKEIEDIVDQENLREIRNCRLHRLLDVYGNKIRLCIAQGIKVYGLYTYNEIAGRFDTYGISYNQQML
jgi:hypothetical protein